MKDFRHSTGTNPRKVTDLPWIIGGHDVAAILGASPYKTPLQVWAEKLGQVEREDDPKKEAIFRRGHEMEPHLLDIYGAVTKRDVRPVSTPRDLEYTVQGVAPAIPRVHHPMYPWAVSAPDGLVIRQRDGRDQLGTLDAKSVSIWVREKWGEPIEGGAESITYEGGGDERRKGTRVIPTATQVPLAEAIQHQYYMWVEDKPFSSYAVGIVDDRAYRTPIVTSSGAALFGLVDFLWCDVERNEGFIESMKNRMRDFIECLKTATRPDYGTDYRDKETLAKIIGHEDENLEVNLGTEAYVLVRESQELGAKIKEAEHRRDEIAVELMDAMGEAAIGKLPTGNNVTFRTQAEKLIETSYVRKEKRMLRLPQARHMKPLPENDPESLVID